MNKLFFVRPNARVSNSGHKWNPQKSQRVLTKTFFLANLTYSVSFSLYLERSGSSEQIPEELTIAFTVVTVD